MLLNLRHYIYKVKVKLQHQGVEEGAIPLYIYMYFQASFVKDDVNYFLFYFFPDSLFFLSWKNKNENNKEIVSHRL